MIIDLLRLKNLQKNLIIFAPLVFSATKLDYINLINSFNLFIAFSVSSCIVYIINDLADIQSDRQNPLKKNKPIPSGIISFNKAIFILLLLLLILILILKILNLKNINDLIIIYIFNNILYSLFIKKIFFLDLLSVASGYFLRILSGSIVIQEDLSIYLAFGIINLSLLILIKKKSTEISQSKKTTISNFYNNKKIVKIFSLLSALFCIFIYLSYCFSVFNLYNNILLIISIIPVILSINYIYNNKIKINLKRDFTLSISQDRFLIFNFILWIVIITINIHFIK